MKKLHLFLAIFLVAASGWAQSPEKMSYQAVVRNSKGELVINQLIGMRVSIVQGAVNGDAIYSELQNPTTNANGLVTLEIGTGVTSNDLATIDWTQGPYFIRTEIDPTGGASYTITGITQLLSVPYALHAKTAENISGGINETDPTFTAWDKSTGISISASQISDLGAYVENETDPVYSASQAASITATDITNLGNLSGTNTGDQDISGIAENSQAIKDTALQIRADIPDISGFITSETDPVYGASVASEITASDTTNWSNKLESETDPTFTAWDKSTGISITESQISDLGTYVENETDPVYSASQAASITATDITNLGNLSGTNTGDQDLSGLATKTALADSAAQIRSEIPDVSGFLSSESDPVYSASQAAKITATHIANLNNLSGTNTGDQDLSSLATRTALADSAAQVRSEIPDVSGFLTSESDPTYTSSQAANITATHITNLNNLSGTNTGDQDLSSLATKTALADSAAQVRSEIPDASDINAAETDPVYSASEAANITATHITNLNNLSGTNTGDQDLSSLATKTALADSAAQVRSEIPDVSGFQLTADDGDTDATNELELPTQSGNAGLYLTTDGTNVSWASASSQWTTSGSNIYYNTGNVGIGTTSPGCPLSLAGGVLSSWGMVTVQLSSATSETGLQLLNTGTGGQGYALFSTSNASALGGGKLVIGDWTNQAARLTINSSGNVGIGTTSPGSALEIGIASGSDWASNLRFTRSGTPNADTRIAVASDGLLFRNFDSSTDTQFSFRDFNDVHIWDLKSGGRNLFNGATDDNSYSVQIGGTYSLRTEGQAIFNGNVGIGTTNPGVKLQVTGDQNAPDSEQLIITGSTNTNKKLRLGYNTTDNYGIIQAITYGSSYDPLLLNPNGGNVGIGTTSPAVPLHVATTVDGFTNPNGANIRFFNYNQDLIQVSSGDYPTLNSVSIYAAGDIITSSSFIAASDKRIKTDIEEIHGSLDIIKKLRPVQYTKINKIIYGNRLNYGFIAQEVEAVIPNAVNTGKGEVPVLKPFENVTFEEGVTYTILVKNGDNIKEQKYTAADPRPQGEIIVKSKTVNDFKSITYDMIFTVAVDAIQEQQAAIEAQQKQIDELKAQNAALAKKAEAFDQLKADVENLKKAMNENKLVSEIQE